MKKIFKRYFGRDYQTVGELVFGYLLIFLTMPFFAPYWFARNSFMKINEKHGFVRGGYRTADPEKIGVNIGMNIAAGIIFIFTLIGSTIPESQGGVPFSLNLIPIFISTILTPFIFFLANIRLDYVKKPKEKKEKKPKIKPEDLYEGKEELSFHEKLSEFKKISV